MMPGDSLGKTEADVRAALTQQGYTVGDVEREDGAIQAEVTANGQAMEVTVDRGTGKVVAVEQDDHDPADRDGKDDDGAERDGKDRD